jgi:hypothetical protein
MKRIFAFVLACCVAAMYLLSSCAKEGPQGVPGPQGDQGAAGAAGPAGADGSVIYSGTGAPATGVGQDGDYYLDRNTGNLYGPKTDSGWGTPILLGGGQGDTTGGAGAQGPAGPQGPQGPQGPPGSNGANGSNGSNGATGATGATGTAGSQIYSGNGAPAGSLGTNGDYYLDKTNYLLYGPKTAGGWGTPTLLRGAQGAQGPAGPAGVAGSQIYSGTGAPAATLGTVGDYYLDKSNVNFYGPKTANGWGTPISLNGGTGGQGPAGPQGPQGPPGTNGTNGTNGSNGAPGAAGATGATGAAGSQIYSGTGQPPAATGKTGDYFIDDMHAILYGPKTAAGWPSTGLSLQVNNTITYDFVNKVANSLPYSWQTPISLNYTGTANYIYLPYNNATAQTTGFTIPQAIVDNGIVLAYIRYFIGPANDTATDLSMTAWIQLPTPAQFYINGIILPVDLVTSIDDNGLYIDLKSAQAYEGNDYAGANTPAVIRIVLIPGSQINTVTDVQRGLHYSNNR